MRSFGRIKFSYGCTLAAILLLLPTLSSAKEQALRLTTDDLAEVLYLGGSGRMACYSEKALLGTLSPPVVALGAKFKPFDSARRLKQLKRRRKHLRDSLGAKNLSFAMKKELLATKKRLHLLVKEINSASIACQQFVETVIIPAKRGKSRSSPKNSSSKSSPGSSVSSAISLPSSLPNSSAMSQPTSSGQSSSSSSLNISSSASSLVPNCGLSLDTWQNIEFPRQIGLFTAVFDAIPLTANMDGVIGLSFGTTSTYSHLAVLVRFNTDGIIDVRNGGYYSYDTPLAYVPGTAYSFRLEVNVPMGTYSVSVVPSGSQTAVPLAANYSFRSEQSGTASLDYLAFISGIGSLTLCDFQVQQSHSSQSPSSVSSLSSTSSSPSSSSHLSSSSTSLNSSSSVSSTLSSSSVSSSPMACNYVINAGESINKYSNTVTAGQTVCVRAGTYYETLRPLTSGQAGNLITYAAHPGDGCRGSLGERKEPGSCEVVINGQGSRNLGVNLSGVQYVRVEGFEITNHTGDAVTIPSGLRGNQIVNNYIHNNAYNAVTAPGARDTLFENNEVYDNGNWAFLLATSAANTDNVVFLGNNIHYNDNDGIWVDGSNILIERNRMYDSIQPSGAHKDAIVSEHATNFVIRYNIISDFTQLVYIALPGGVTARNVQIYGNVFFNHFYKANSGGDLPQVFFELRATNTAVEGLEIYNNTFGYAGSKAQSGSIPIWLNASGGGSYMNDVTIRNNIFYKCTDNPTDRSMILTGSMTNLSSDYNLYYQAQPTLSEPHSVFGDPKFVSYKTPTEDPSFSNWDFHLQALSAAIDQGDSNLASLVNLPSPFVDIDGTQRPEGYSYDIGAYEFKE